MMLAIRTPESRVYVGFRGLREFRGFWDLGFKV